MEKHVALLLTDLVDSTALSSRIGDEKAAELWQSHDRAARTLLRHWSGREIDKSDGFLLMFDSTLDAIAYAREYHKLLRELPAPLRARAGLHVGNVTVRENSREDVAMGAKELEIDGLVKPIAARVMSIAEGGQTLLTTQAAAILVKEGLHVHSHGLWHVKGLDDPIELFEADDADLSLLPLQDTVKAYRVVRKNELWVPLADLHHTLPAERDAFVGRHAALRELRVRFDAGVRLVSVLGAGGMGKTRLAQRFGWSSLGGFQGGVWFCDLSAARTRDAIVRAVAEGLGVPLGKADPLLQVGDALAGRGECLVILDNFEQVLPHAEATLGHWLDRAAKARFIVTSREAICMSGEQVLPLDSLATEDASELFRRRAAAARRAPHTDDDDEAAIARLVGLLDGMPLAIELAAARASLMSPTDLLKRMRERFALLVSKGTRRDRQATLRNTLDWSWELLRPSERSALAQLSVLEGSFNLEAAEAVIDVTQSDGPISALDMLQSLVDKSLTRTRSDGRFDLLASVRDYAAEHLRTEGRFQGSGPLALATAKRRHIDHFAGIGELGAVASSCADLGNLIAACREAVAEQDVASAVRILEAAWAALLLRGPFQLGVDLAQMVGDMPSMTAEWRPRLHAARGWALRSAGRVREAATCLESTLEMARAAGDKRMQSRVLSHLGDLHVTSGRRDLGRTELTEALELTRDIGDRVTECEVSCGLGNLAESLGELGEARSHYEAALVLARTISDRRWEGGCLGNLGTLCANQGRLPEAKAYYQSGLRIARQLGDRQWEGNTLCNLGLLQQSEGDLAQARTTLEQALALAKEMGYVRLSAVVMCNLGIVSETMGAADEARRQYEAAAAVARDIGDRRLEGQALNYLGALIARHGQLAESEVCLDTAERLLTEAADRLSLALLLCSRAEVHQRAADVATTEATLQRAEALAADLHAEPDSELCRAISRVRLALVTRP